MRVASIVTLVVIFFTATTYSLPVTRSLKAIAVLIRHGDRNAVAINPDIKNDWHFDRTGELTNKGCLRMYKHGTILRGHLPDIMFRTSTELRSASVPAPLVVHSLRCFMAGINGPVERLNQIKDPEVYVPKTKGEDTMLNFGRVNCPIRDEALKTDTSFLALYAKYQKLIDQLNNGTGEKLGPLNLMTIIKGRLEPILNAHEVGLPIPDWATDWFLEESHKLATDEFDFMVKFPFQRALSGVFFNELITRFRSISKDSTAFYAFSSVHTTMGPLMKTIEFWTGERPAYGEALIFTLDRNDQFGVEFFNANGTFTQVVPYGCSTGGEACTLDKFERSISKYTSLDWEVECQKPYKETEANL